MKKLLSWLVLALALAVPAAAALAAAVLRPAASPVVVGKKADRMVAAQGVSHRSQDRLASHARPARDAGAKPVADAGQTHSGSLADCDGSDCAQCAVCVSSSNCAGYEPPRVVAVWTAAPARCDSNCPPAEFLRGGQDRPPRAA